jgi:hypothetical protein
LRQQLSRFRRSMVYFFPKIHPSLSPGTVGFQIS